MRYHIVRGALDTAGVEGRSAEKVEIWAKRLKRNNILNEKKNSQKAHYFTDPKYKDVEVTKFVNSLMIDGKKNIAFNIFDSIDIVCQKKHPKMD